MRSVQYYEENVPANNRRHYSFAVGHLLQRFMTCKSPPKTVVCILCIFIKVVIHYHQVKQLVDNNEIQYCTTGGIVLLLWQVFKCHIAPPFVNWKVAFYTIFYSHIYLNM